MSKVKLKYHWPWILWLVVIFLLTGVPGNYIPNVITFSDWLRPDKIVHLIMFGVLGFLFVRGLVKQYSTSSVRYILVIAFIIGVIIGGLTEIMQDYIFTGRDGNVFDFYADSIGSIIGITAFRFVYRKKSINS